MQHSTQTCKAQLSTIVTTTVGWRSTVLHQAAQQGHDKVIAGRTFFNGRNGPKFAGRVLSSCDVWVLRYVQISFQSIVMSGLLSDCNQL